MTINNPIFIEEMLNNGGVCSGDPAAHLIYSYRSLEGKDLFAVFYDPEDDDMLTSLYVADVICLMANSILTVQGQKWLKNYNTRK